MLADRAGGPGIQSIVEPPVIGKVEAFLLELPLHIPVHLGHEEESGVLLADSPYGLAPERGIHGWGAVARQRHIPPGSSEDFRLDQHGHITADTVAAIGDMVQ